VRHNSLITSLCFVLMVNSVIVIVLLATTSRHDMHHTSYVFGSDGIINQTNGWDNGVAFLFGLLSVQWTVRVNSFRIRVNYKPISLFLDDGMFQCLM
jgi:hypothetical protein